MANYQFLDAYGSVKSAASSTISGVEYPVFKFADSITVNTASVSGTVGASIIGLPAFLIAGSVATVGTGAANQSVSGTVGASIVGQLPAGTAIIGSVAVLQGTSPWNVAGSVVAAQIGNRSASIVSITPSSVLVGASIFGQLPAGTAVLGSVATLQGTNPWVIVGSIQGSGSVVAFQGTVPWTISSVYGNISGSIAGTFAEDSAHTTGDPALFVLGVRNDNISSFVNANTDYTPLAVDSAGRSVIKPFASEDGTIISFSTSVVSTSVTLIQASTIGKRSYITDYWVVNTGATTTLITFQGGDTSVIAYAIAPNGGGISSPGISIPLKTTLSQDLAFKATNATSVLYLTVKGYVAP